MIDPCAVAEKHLAVLCLEASVFLDAESESLVFGWIIPSHPRAVAVFFEAYYEAIFIVGYRISELPGIFVMVSDLWKCEDNLIAFDVAYKPAVVVDQGIYGFQIHFFPSSLV